MNAVLRRRVEMAARVRDFLRAHRTEGVGDGAAFARFDELVTRAEALAAQQRAGIVTTRSATMQRDQVRRSLQIGLLKYLAAVGTIAAKGNAELAAEFRLPNNGTSQMSFLATARGMLEKATARKELLVSLGMSEKLLEDLAGAIVEFEQTLEASRAGRREHVGASADLKAVATEIVEQVKLLDGLVRYRFGDNPELMGAWASARNVLGPFKPRVEQAPEGSETPGTDPKRIAPAA
ncbi:MAG TPA: hypothetical protein VFM24_00455 [Nitrospira sp.]|nr:hypothetical protein [Nitrospira sp.]